MWKAGASAPAKDRQAMSIVLRPAANKRHPFILALLATTAAATLLGGCMRTGGMSDMPELTATDAKMAGDPQANAAATAKWAAAYAKKPQDTKLALGYARALRAVGSKDRAMQVMQAAFQANQTNGELAAEFGRLALDVGRLDIAKYTLHVAETQGINDWKTLSAQGTLHAKAGEHGEAQRYFLAALQTQPDAISVTNNLALSYALDNKADKAEALLRNAVASGHDDKRVRQNLALVLGVQGKFDEARKIASTDMPEADAKANMAYLKAMLSAPTSVASLGPDDGTAEVESAEWESYAENAPASAPARTAMAGPPPIQARTIETPLVAHSAAAAKGDRVAAAQPNAPVAPQGSGSTTIAKSPTIAAAPETPAAPKGDKLAGTPDAPTRTATLLKADIE
jgi:Flp pilus assembly protein TadD